MHDTTSRRGSHFDSPTSTVFRASQFARPHGIFATLHFLSPPYHTQFSRVPIALSTFGGLRPSPCNLYITQICDMFRVLEPEIIRQFWDLEKTVKTLRSTITLCSLMENGVVRRRSQYWYFGAMRCTPVRHKKILSAITEWCATQTDIWHKYMFHFGFSIYDVFKL